jgi:hypothetical protein
MSANSALTTPQATAVASFGRPAGAFWWLRRTLTVPRPHFLEIRFAGAVLDPIAHHEICRNNVRRGGHLDGERLGDLLGFIVKQRVRDAQRLGEQTHLFRAATRVLDPDHLRTLGTVLLGELPNTGRLRAAGPSPVREKHQRKKLALVLA